MKLDLTHSAYIGVHRGVIEGACNVVLDDSTLVLNRNWVPVDVTTVLNALCKLYEGSARVLDHDYTLHDFESWKQVAAPAGQSVVRTATLQIPVPEIIVLAKYGKVPDRHLAFSRANLYRRDRYTCQYCGKRPGTQELTIDHVLPRSRGGTSNWTNCVVACVGCNSWKADKHPHEAGLHLRRKPQKPEFSPMLVVGQVRYKASWEKFVSDVYWNTELTP